MSSKSQIDHQTGCCFRAFVADPLMPKALRLLDLAALTGEVAEAIPHLSPSNIRLNAGGMFGAWRGAPSSEATNRLWIISHRHFLHQKISRTTANPPHWPAKLNLASSTLRHHGHHAAPLFPFGRQRPLRIVSSAPREPPMPRPVVGDGWRPSTPGSLRPPPGKETRPPSGPRLLRRTPHSTRRPSFVGFSLPKTTPPIHPPLGEIPG
mmetsp:Transcript_13647/g.39867  ORF Transcript_13647/g.39867 Transcript_13647/m.39867 type:complete len:208 (+) Transcript_13647:3736-4359(+)